MNVDVRIIYSNVPRGTYVNHAHGFHIENFNQISFETARNLLIEFKKNPLGMWFNVDDVKIKGAYFK